MTVIIGLTARKGRGKSTLSAMLKEQIVGAEIVGFADALRADVASMLAREIGPDRPGDFELWLENNKATIYGPMLQGFGELARQWFGADYWVERVDNYICASDAPAVIIPDVRYINEAEFIKSRGGLLVAIEGPCRWEGDTRDNAHPSETGVDACAKLADITIGNMWGLDELRRFAEKIAGDVKCKS